MIIEPPRTSLHINSLFIRLYSNEGQSYTNAHITRQSEFGYKDFAFSFFLSRCYCWFVPFHHQRDFHFDAKSSQSYE